LSRVPSFSRSDSTGCGQFRSGNLPVFLVGIGKNARCRKTTRRPPGLLKLIMATAWARDGRVVIRKPATDYGVEVAAPPDVSRLQVRHVGSARPSPLRDVQRYGNDLVFRI
jgi:hypothetical protein